MGQIAWTWAALCCMPTALYRSVSFVYYLRLSLPMYTQDNHDVFNTSTNGSGMPADLALWSRGSGGQGGGVRKHMACAGDSRIVEVRGAAKTGEARGGNHGMQCWDMPNPHVNGFMETDMLAQCVAEVKVQGWNGSVMVWEVYPPTCLMNVGYWMWQCIVLQHR